MFSQNITISKLFHGLPGAYIYNVSVRVVISRISSFGKSLAYFRSTCCIGSGRGGWVGGRWLRSEFGQQVINLLSDPTLNIFPRHFHYNET